MNNARKNEKKIIKKEESTSVTLLMRSLLGLNQGPPD